MVRKNPEWLNQEDYPFRSRYLQINGHQLHYLEEGEGEVLLFVHGTPSWSFEFRKLIKSLRNDFRCIAIDHMGFGLSDKPQTYDYTTINQSRTLTTFIKEKGLRNINLLVHDFGGPIGLNFAIEHPEKVCRIVILNSWLWSNESDPDFRKMRKLLRSPLLPFLYRYLNFSPRFLLPKSFGNKKISKKLISQYTKPFTRIRERQGPIAFLKSLLDDQQWFQELWNKRSTIADKPTLLIWGMKDSLLHPRNLEKFEAGFSRNYSVRLDSVGHFPQEEEPEKVSEEIRKFFILPDIAGPDL